MAVYKFSRYEKVGVHLTNEDTLCLNTREPIKFDLTKATYHTVVEKETVDGIAYQVYNNAQLWWAIMDANPKLTSPIDIVPGTTLLIPSFEEVRKYV